MGMTLNSHYSDSHLIVVEKPSGLLSVPGRRESDCALVRLQTEFPEVLVVHRLDQATSGLLLFARTKAAQRAMSLAFSDGLVEKEYVAVVHGQLISDAGEVNLPMRRDMSSSLPPRYIIDDEFGKPSHTRWQVETRTADTTRIRLFPSTGRSHQLRVHCHALGHPIVGDSIYGSPIRTANSLPNPIAESPPTTRMHLHATRLRFPHPATSAILEITSPPPF